MKMHDGEADIDAELVRRLVAAQFPALAGLPVTAFRSTGTVNAIYRLGGGLYGAGCRGSPGRRGTWSRRPAGCRGWRGGCRWRSPSRWPPGGPVMATRSTRRSTGGSRGSRTRAKLVDERQAARDLARFVTELRRMDTTDAPRAGRRPLRELDAGTRAGIEEAGDDIDHDAVLAASDLALEAPPSDGAARAWIHAGLLPPNLLVGGGRLRAVIDFGAAGAGDPAADLIAAWSVFGPAGREVFRDAPGAGDGDWDRARGVALHQAVRLIPYYRVTNPGMAALGRRTAGQVLADIRARG